MSEVSKPVRLSKAAREFNLGLDTIVEFLASKGIEVERKPNTKLEPEHTPWSAPILPTKKSPKERPSRSPRPCWMEAIAVASKKAGRAEEAPAPLQNRPRSLPEPETTPEPEPVVEAQSRRRRARRSRKRNLSRAPAEAGRRVLNLPSKVVGKALDAVAPKKKTKKAAAKKEEPLPEPVAPAKEEKLPRPPAASRHPEGPAEQAESEAEEAEVSGQGRKADRTHCGRQD